MFGDGFSVGLFFPIVTGNEAIPTMNNQVSLARQAESLGFDALWFRDVPLYSPTFGDAGQIYDPWVYLAHVGAQTEEIALTTGSIVLPLRHPLHVAKAAASVDVLTDGRLVLGVASGDRPEEFPAFGVRRDPTFLFRESVRLLRECWSEEYPSVESAFGDLDGSLEILPKPTTDTLPLLVTGHAGQSLEWIADHGDGWVYYQRSLADVESQLATWRDLAGPDKPYVQVLHIDLLENREAEGHPIHQGFAGGADWFREHIHGLRAAGVDHVMINIRKSSRDPAVVLDEFAETVLESL